MLRVTKTENGAVRGLPGTNARITVFKGIPYAAPPVGELRWRAPQPAKDWEGVRECFEYGPIAMQTTPGKDPDAFYSKEWHVDPEIPMSEDCLYLNVWTPAKTGDEKMPVMMWIHGGGMQEGYGHEQEFDGEQFAKRGIVLVSITYRLNVFAFMAHKELTAAQPEDPANFGLLDCIAALKWIKRNIANFGGDPDNVTIFGQSGGGHASEYLTASPLAKGLFQRAIFQSPGFGALALPNSRFFGTGTKDLAYGEAFGQEFLDYLGVKTIEEARKLDAKYVNDKQVQYRAETFKFMFPLVDNVFCTKDPNQAMLDGDMNDVDIMLTVTGDEFMVGPMNQPLDAWVEEAFGKYGDEFMAAVREKAGSNDPEALKKAATFSSFHAANLLSGELLAHAGKDVYFEIFDPEIPGDDAGSFHSCDLWFEFDNLRSCWRPFDGHHYDIARKMCNYFSNFARTGDPNGKDADGTDMPNWETYGHNHFTLFFGDEVKKLEKEDPVIRAVVNINLKNLGLL